MMRAGPASPKIVGIQALRGIAACGVVLCHMTGFETKYLAGPSVLPSSFRFGMVGVDLFFVLSGFIMTSMSLGKFRRPGEAGRFLTRRFLRVYPIYWAWSVPVLVLFLMRPDMVNSSHGRPDVLRSLLLVPQEHLPLLLVAWTLVYEIFFYIVFSAALRWLRQTDLPWALGGWAAVVIAGNWLVLPAKTDPMLGLMFSPLLLEFMMGCAVALCVSRLNGTAAIVAMTLGTGGFVFGTIFYLLHGGWFPSDWNRALLYGASSATLLAGLVAWERVIGRPILRSLAGLGDASYSLYLSHVPVVAAMGLVCRHLLPASLPAAHLAAVSATFAVALLAGFASFRLIEAPLLRLSHRLSFDALWRPFTADVMFAHRRVVGLLRATH